MEKERVITISLRNTGRQKKKERPDYRKEYKKDGPTQQDRVSANPTLMKEKLKHFEKIPPSEYELVEPGTYVRYLCHKSVPGKSRPETKFRMGGYVTVNAYPDYWTLQSRGQNKKFVTWCVPLKVKPGQIPNDYYKKKGVLCKTQKVKEAESAYDSIIRKEVCLIDPRELNRLRRIAGELDDNEMKGTQNFSFHLDEEDDEIDQYEEEDSDNEHRPKRIVTLLDD